MWSVSGQCRNFYFFDRACPYATLPLAVFKQRIWYSAFCCDIFRPAFTVCIICSKNLNPASDVRHSLLLCFCAILTVLSARQLGRAHIETQATQPALGEAAQVSVTHVFDNDSAS